MSQPMDQLPATFQHLSMTSGLRAAAARNPGKIAYKQDDRERPYGELVERIDRISNAITCREWTLFRIERWNSILVHIHSSM